MGGKMSQEAICYLIPLLFTQCIKSYLHIGLLIGILYSTSIKIIKNEVGCRDNTMPKTLDTRRHCEED